jgi:hypothetical protein
MRRDRFVKITGATKGPEWALVERARQLAGLKGYVTNLPTTTMDGAAVIAAYHDLWHVQSFRMTKSDLRARPCSTTNATPRTAPHFLTDTEACRSSTSNASR